MKVISKCTIGAFRPHQGKSGLLTSKSVPTARLVLGGAATGGLQVMECAPNKRFHAMQAPYGACAREPRR